MAILQIIYLLINIIGTTAGLVWFFQGQEVLLISQFFTFVKKHFGNIALAVVGIIFILLFIPTLTFIAAIIAFLMLWGDYSD